MRNKKFSAFSLVELSIVILIIGVLASAVMGSRAILANAALSSARSLTKSSPVASMTKGLVLWLDTVSEKSFKSTVKNDNDSVDTWYDINPLAAAPSTTTQGTSGYQPKYSEKAINGLPALKFDGTDDFMLVGNPYRNDYYPAISNNFAIFMVVLATATHEVDTQATSGDAGTSGQKYLLYPSRGSTIYPNVSNAVGTGISMGINGISFYEHTYGYMPPLMVYSSTTNKPLAMLMEYNNKTPSLYVNGTLVATGLQSPQSYSFASYLIGGSSNDSFVFQGYIGEIIIFNRALSTDEKTNVNNYLKKKWRIG